MAGQLRILQGEAYRQEDVGQDGEYEQCDVSGDYTVEKIVGALAELLRKCDELLH